jgi:hypothetical protein
MLHRSDDVSADESVQVRVVLQAAEDSDVRQHADIVNCPEVSGHQQARFQ